MIKRRFLFLTIASISLFGCGEKTPELESGAYEFEVAPLTSFDNIQDTLYYNFMLSIVADEGTDQEDVFFKSNGMLTFYKSYMFLSDADYFKHEIAWGALEYDPNNDFYLDQWQLAKLSGDYEIASKAKCKVYVDTDLRSRYNEDGYEHCFESELRFVFMTEEGSYEEQKEEMGTFSTRTNSSTGPWEGYNITYTWANLQNLFFARLDYQRPTFGLDSKGENWLNKVFKTERPLTFVFKDTCSYIPDEFIRIEYYDTVPLPQDTTSQISTTQL